MSPETPRVHLMMSFTWHSKYDVTNAMVTAEASATDDVNRNRCSHCQAAVVRLGVQLASLPTWTKWDGSGSVRPLVAAQAKAPPLPHENECCD